jgi:hypothetical protein
MKHLALIAALSIAAAPAMAQYTAVPYGQGTLLLPNGPSGMTTSGPLPPSPPPMFVPNAQFHQAPQFKNCQPMIGRYSC